MAQNKRKKRKKKSVSMKKRWKKRSQFKEDRGKIFYVPFPKMDPSASVAELIEKLAVVGERNKKRFNELLGELRRLVVVGDPILLLSAISFKNLLLWTPETDEERFRAAPFGQPHVEVLQALCLRRQLSEFKFNLDVSQYVEEVERALEGLFQSSIYMRLTSAKNINTDEEKARHLLIEEMRISTQAVRNWGYAYQVRKIVDSIFSPIGGEFEAQGKLDPGKFFHSIDKLIHLMRERLFNHLDRVAPAMKSSDIRGVVREYAKADFMNVDDIEKTCSLILEHNATVDQVKLMVYCHSFLHFPKCVSFSTSEFIESCDGAISQDGAREVLGSYSIQFGELKSYKEEHLFLSNPIWSRPFILHKDRYYFFIPSLLYSYPYLFLENLFLKNTRLFESYDRRRGKATEELVEGVFSKLKGALILRGSIWEDPGSSKSFENDLLIKIGGVLFLVEAKSGRVPAAARRGAKGSLRTVISDQIVEPARQSGRFEAFLRSQMPKTVSLANRNSERSSQLELHDVSALVRLSVTLEDFGSILVNSSNLSETGFVAEDAGIPLTMTLCDLEQIFQVLSLDAQRIHYLLVRSRRVLFEKIVGDEMDMLALYLKTGFSAPSEGVENAAVNISGLSKVFDSFFCRFDSSELPPRPEMKLRKWWREILLLLDARRPAGWAQLSCVLLGMPYEFQRHFEKAFNRIKKEVRRHFDELQTKCIVNAPAEFLGRKCGVCAVAYRDFNKEERDRFLRGAALKLFDSIDGCRFVLLIGVDVLDGDPPYSIISIVANDLTDVW